MKHTLVLILLTLGCTPHQNAQLGRIGGLLTEVCPELGSVPADSTVVVYGDAYRSSLPIPGETTDGGFIASVKLSETDFATIEKVIRADSAQEKGRWKPLPLSEDLLRHQAQLQNEGEHHVSLNVTQGFFLYADRSPRKPGLSSILSFNYTLIVLDTERRMLLVRVFDM